LWEAPSRVIPSEVAATYWEAIENAILGITGKRSADLAAHKQLEIEQTKEIGQEGIAYWEGVIEGYRSLSRKQAISELIKSQKIEEKIRTIRRMIAKDIVA
jgi:hypothetical protein